MLRIECGNYLRLMVVGYLGMQGFGSQVMADHQSMTDYSPLEIVEIREPSRRAIAFIRVVNGSGLVLSCFRF